MDAKELPARPSLEQYKKLAKELVKACQSGAPEAIRAIRTRYPEAARFTDDKLIQYIKQRHPRHFIAPSKAWERGNPCERMKPFERSPTGESPVRQEP